MFRQQESKFISMKLHKKQLKSLGQDIRIENICGYIEQRVPATYWRNLTFVSEKVANPAFLALSRVNFFIRLEQK